MVNREHEFSKQETHWESIARNYWATLLNLKKQELNTQLTFISQSIQVGDGIPDMSLYEFRKELEGLETFISLELERMDELDSDHPSERAHRSGRAVLQAFQNLEYALKRDDEIDDSQFAYAEETINDAKSVLNEMKEK